MLATFFRIGSSLEVSSNCWPDKTERCEPVRLLLTAKDDIEHYAERFINDLSSARDFAFDIVALIKAARRAPGPAEPAEAKKLLDQAMADLAWIADMPVAELMADAAAPAAQQQDQVEWRKLACSANYEVQRLAQTMVRLADQLDLDAQPVFHGLAARIAQLSEIVYSAGRLHGEDPAEAGTPPLKELQHIFAGGLCLG
ncbi:hypothetical protein [Delftia sp. WSY_7]|uniref:hypothetical protein n=1 Tax=Delftia sp. WSY_7 TaxID=3367202 RepID=UPI00370B01C7